MFADGETQSIILRQVGHLMKIVIWNDVIPSVRGQNRQIQLPMQFSKFGEIIMAG